MKPSSRKVSENKAENPKLIIMIDTSFRSWLFKVLIPLFNLYANCKLLVPHEALWTRSRPIKVVSLFFWTRGSRNLVLFQDNKWAGSLHQVPSSRRIFAVPIQVSENDKSFPVSDLSCAHGSVLCPCQPVKIGETESISQQEITVARQWSTNNTQDVSQTAKQPSAK